jgi:hypothetical protein
VQFPWWGRGERPKGYLQVASSDGYLILLNTQTEKISAFLCSESYDKAKSIAHTFDLFLRTVSTIYIHRRISNTREFTNEIAKSLVSSNYDSAFWHEIIN